MKRVVITGIGMVTPIGSEKSEVLDALKNKKVGIKPIQGYNTEAMQVKIAAEVPDFTPDPYIDKKAAKRMDRVSQMAIVAAKKALADSGLDPALLTDNIRVGTSIATGIGGLYTIEKEHSRGLVKGFDRVSPFFIPMAIANMTSAFVAIELGIHGGNQCIVTACASSTDAIGESFRKIKGGYMDIMLTGGAEASITPLGIGGFTSMTALSDSNDPNRASIPFDKERSGFVMGEGSGILVLEEREHALKRGAHIYGEVVGFGTSCDAGHMTAPDPHGKFAGMAIEAALAEAGITPRQIDYINAHGTSTPLNDKTEAAVISRIFGNDCPVSSTKSMTGHLLGASGAVDSILTLLAMKENFYPMTANYQVPDEDISIRLITEFTPARIEYALKSSLGFGGHNSILIFKKGDVHE